MHFASGWQKTKATPIDTAISECGRYLAEYLFVA